MPQQRVNDIELFYEQTGQGAHTLVLVHGSWTDHLSWQLLVPTLAERHTVVSYDRRGHSRSRARAGSLGSRRQHEDDLAALIETLDLGTVTLVGNSYGGSIALGLAARRPDLVHGVIAHEPPLLGVGRFHPLLEADLVDVFHVVARVSDLLQADAPEEGATVFVDYVLGPGTWQMLPDGHRRTFIANAATFVDMIADPSWAEVSASGAVPVLLTDGRTSPPWLPAIVEALASAVYTHAERHTFEGGHMPHLTHPDRFATVVESFVAAPAHQVTSPR